MIPFLLQSQAMDFKINSDNRADTRKCLITQQKKKWPKVGKLLIRKKLSVLKTKVKV